MSINRTVLDVLSDLLRKEKAPLEIMEINYRISVLSISRELKAMHFGGKGDVELHYTMLMNLKYLMLMHGNNEDNDDFRKFNDKINVIFLPVARIFPAKIEDYERKVMPIIKSAENVWYAYRQGIRRL